MSSPLTHDVEHATEQLRFIAVLFCATYVRQLTSCVQMLRSIDLSLDDTRGERVATLLPTLCLIDELERPVSASD
jgi:hypothetical protein